VGNIEFAWDRRKVQSNLAKHGVSFEEAQTVFLDENARLIDDPDHSKVEERFVLLGCSFQARCLIVSHCYRESNAMIRLISARRATAQGGRSVLEIPMRNEYDFSKSRKNSYAKQLKRQITIRLDTMAVNYFKGMAAELGIPYQNLINLFLRDCAIEKRRPVIQWPSKAPKDPVRR
jgi:uncharacterized DUF497 family protein/predicted DNA binding CopG/RHH family protein